MIQLADIFPGIVHQIGFPPADVLLLPLQHDCCSYPRRVPLDVDYAHNGDNGSLCGSPARMLARATSLVTANVRKWKTIDIRLGDGATRVRILLEVRK